MNPSIEAILNALLGDQSNTGFSAVGGDLDPMATGHNPLSPSNTFSPVNFNPNYLTTIQKYFGSNPVGGVTPYQGPAGPATASPLSQMSTNSAHNSVPASQGYSAMSPPDLTPQSLLQSVSPQSSLSPQSILNALKG